MEGHGHDPVSGVEGLLHTISMMDVYVDVQHSLVVPGTEQSCDQSTANFVAAIQGHRLNTLFQQSVGILFIGDVCVCVCVSEQMKVYAAIRIILTLLYFNTQNYKSSVSAVLDLTETEALHLRIQKDLHQHSEQQRNALSKC